MTDVVTQAAELAETQPAEVVGVFDNFMPQAYPFKFEGTLRVATIAGGVPANERVAEAWIRAKVEASDDTIRSMVAKTMADRGIEGKDPNVEESIQEVLAAQHMNGFKRDDNGLFIEGRQLKAALKEAGSIAVAAGSLPSRGWGKTNKGIKSFLAEHVFVLDDRLHLRGTSSTPKAEECISSDGFMIAPTGVNQSFVHTHHGDSIKYEEYCRNVDVNFTLITDQEMSREEWGMLWLKGGMEGIGASRSQGFGRYKITKWEAVES